MLPSSRGLLLAYLGLFAALYAAFGALSPYVPALLKERGLQDEAIGIALASGTAIRLAAGPAAGRLADRLAAGRLIVAGCAAAAAAAALGYFSAHAFWPLLTISLIQAAALAPLAPLCDSLVLAAAGNTRADFNYGWIRGAGSAAFIIGSMASGQLVGKDGLAAVLWLNAALLIATAAYAPFVRVLREPAAAQPHATAQCGGIAILFGIAEFRRVVLVAALILGSHALHDSFAMIRWIEAGIAPGTAGLLWSEAVAAEVVIFLLIGRPLLDRLGPNGAAMMAAGAAALRWGVSAETAWVPAVAAIQPLHGLTFALLHLACMRRLAETVPQHLSATALTLYGTFGIGTATALLTLASGWLYAVFGAFGFWVMAALCLVALPIARRL